jgi:hypothetical protein
MGDSPFPFPSLELLSTYPFFQVPPCPKGGCANRPCRLYYRYWSLANLARHLERTQISTEKNRYDLF